MEEIFHYGAHDILVPHPEAKKWPPEEWRQALSQTFDLLHFNPPIISGQIDGKMDTSKPLNVPLYLGLDLDTVAVCTGFGGHGPRGPEGRGVQNSLNEALQEQFHRWISKGGRTNISDTLENNGMKFFL